jgi:threonine synthase
VNSAGTRLVCAGCGQEAGTVERRPYPFRCENARAGDDIDHVIRRVLDPGCVHFPAESHPHPFIRYRTLMHAWHLATSHGLADEAYCEIAASLDAHVASVDGHGFAVTPFAVHGPLGEALGLGRRSLWIKDETRNVSGSHKARHLMGLALYLEMAERVASNRAASEAGMDARDRSAGLRARETTLAIASCGNAALAAAVIARAARRPLRVFVPPGANAAVLSRLRTLDAQVVTCRREPGVAGDPCYARFREFIEKEGGVPFCCQGGDNGLTIEGGATLGYEMIDGLGGTRLDRLFVQVGGGALASACLQAFTDAQELGRLDRLPRLHAVQTRGAFPLKRAYDRVVARIFSHMDLPASSRPEDDESSASFVLG